MSESVTMIVSEFASEPIILKNPQDTIDKLTVFREPTEGRLLCEDARLSGKDVLPGFECRVAELFGGWALLPVKCSDLASWMRR